MIKKHVLASAAFALFGVAAAPAIAANQPAAGIYQLTQFTTAVSGGVNGECDNWGPANSEATPAFFTYPGPSQSGAMQRAPSIGPGFGFVYTISYSPVTPARGRTSWSGMYKAAFVPAPPNGAPWSGVFTQSWTFVDSSSYAYTGTLSGLPSANGNYVCGITFEGIAIQTGK